ncbi:MAG: hypothetical protein L6Q57_01725 [Alphaproteobacteria bacterium]|nr:hypothetical protein [Alphaproteobacteria bacterium]
MTNPNQNTNKAENADKFASFNAKIKETYSKMNDDDVKLYDGKRDQFFAKLQEKQNVSKEDGERKMKELEQTCGCSSTTNNENSSIVKVA